jgi:hypothetical protein
MFAFASLLYNNLREGKMLFEIKKKKSRDFYISTLRFKVIILHTRKQKYHFDSTIDKIQS